MDKRKKYRPLPLNELAICRRVREEREGTLLRQREFAHSIGLSRDQLASIEGGRVPVRDETGITLSREFDINPLWLALGGDFEQERWIDFPAFRSPFPRVPFSEFISAHRDAYERVRDRFFAQEHPAVFMENRSNRGLTVEMKALIALFNEWKIRIVPEDYWAVARHLRREADSFNIVKGALTQHARMRMVSRMKPQESSRWEQLRRRLISATTAAGAQSKLALRMKVTRQAVSEWLRRTDRAPSADTTLRLLEWVTAEEAKQQQTKRAGSASTQPALKTRKSKSKSHEKAKSDQKKS